MSRKNSTIRTLKTTARVASKTGRATAKATRFTHARWRGLLPVLCVAAAGLFAGVTHLLTWLVTTWESKALILSVGVVLFIWADGAVGQLDVSRRKPAIAFVLFTVATAVALIGWPHVKGVYMAIIVGDLALGTWWWNGTAYQSFRATERAKRRLEGILPKLGVSDGTHITSVTENAKRDVEWRLFLGDQDRPGQIKAADVAHLLKIETSRVIVKKVDGDSTRQLKIVQLGKALKKVASVTHPAAEPGGQAEGSPWAPGARHIAQGAPIGPRADNPDSQVVFHLYEPGYGARHNLIAGMTGSGKSVTISSILEHCAASDDCVIAGVDLMKGGETFMPFDEAGVMVRHLYIKAEDVDNDAVMLSTARELLDDLKWLRGEVGRRTANMASGRVLDVDGERTKNWPASPKHPVIAFFFEEYTSTVSAISKLDADLGAEIEETVNEVGKLARSSGISINIVTQRAALDELPAVLRAQLSQTILHKLNSSNDKGKLWEEYDIDLRMLAGGKGLCFADQPGGEDPALVKAFNLSKPKVCTKIAAAYTDHQSVFVWGADQQPGAAQDGQKVPDGAEGAPGAAEAPGALNLMQDAFGDDAIPAGARVIGGAADLAPGDDERLAAIVNALAEAGTPLSRTEIQAKTGLGMTVAKDLLTCLKDNGKVVHEGKGRASKYRLALELAGTNA